MKRTAYIFTFLLAAFAFCGCASTGETTTAAQGMSVENALQKSAEVRQQVNDAKTAAKAAQATGAASSSSGSAKAAVKDAAKEAAKPAVEEYNAWKDALK